MLFVINVIAVKVVLNKEFTNGLDVSIDLA